MIWFLLEGWAVVTTVVILFFRGCGIVRQAERQMERQMERLMELEARN